MTRKIPGNYLRTLRTARVFCNSFKRKGTGGKRRLIQRRKLDGLGRYVEGE